MLSGKMLTGRDAAHKKMVEMIADDEELPVDLNGRFIYYVGPVDPIGDEVVGPAGPTTIEAIRDHESVYLMAVGGAAYLVSQAIKASEVVAFPELGMEAVYEFRLEDMPVTVAVDPTGESVHQIGPKFWAEKINQRIVNFGA